MKRLLLALLPMAIASVACHNEKSADNSSEAPKPVKIDTFCSADRAFADVRGNAKQCVIVTTEMEQSADTLKAVDEGLTSTIEQTFTPNGYISTVKQTDTFMDQPVGTSLFAFEFDDNGQLQTSTTDFDGRFMVKRDKTGYVTTFTSIGANGSVDYTKNYTWRGPQLLTQQLANDKRPTDEDGNPLPVPVDKIVYTYDDDGYRLTETEESGDPQLEINVTETRYKYKGHDDHGNWISRDVSRMAKVYKVAGGKRILTDSVSTYQREERAITYY